MLSKFAKGDFSDLEAQGIRLTPEEIITLNELGLRVERAATSADINACPRIGWAGNVPIHEPTLQAEEWMDTYAARFAEDEPSYWSLFLFACAHATRPGFFADPSLHTPEGVQAAADAWRASCPATRDQLDAAFAYAYLGSDPGADIIPEPDHSKSSPPNSPNSLPPLNSPSPPSPSPIDSALALGLGLSVAELSTLTSNRLYAILSKWYANKGYSSKHASIRPHGEYIRTLHAIKARHLPPLPQEPTP